MTLQHLKTPLIDNTGYHGQIDIMLTGNQSSVDNLRKEFQRYDLDLVLKKMPVTVLVIADVK